MIAEVSKYRSYIQGLITENLGVMTSKKLLGIKPTLKVRPESCQTQEKLSPRSDLPAPSENSTWNWETGSHKIDVYSNRECEYGWRAQENARGKENASRFFITSLSLGIKITEEKN